MNIWILNHYAGAYDVPLTRHFDFSRQLVSRGHKVTIFASSFNHYGFVDNRLSPNEKWKEEDIEGVKFIWIKTLPYKGNEGRRFLNMISYAWRVIWVGRSYNEMPDVIIGSSVHLLAALSAYVLSKTKNSRFFFEVRDLWPQTLIDMGALSEKGLIAKLMRLLEKYLYKRAEKIISPLPYLYLYTEKLGIRRDKFVWIPNGADLNRYDNINKYDGSFSENFNVVYLGTHGKANVLHVILDAAKILQDEGVNPAKVIFVGDGPEKPRLIQYAHHHGIKNVEFRNHTPKDELYKVLNEAQACIIVLENLKVYEYGIGLNKFNDYFLSGRPVIFSGNSGNDPVSDAKAGISVPGNDPKAIALAIKRLMELSPQERAEMGKNGIEYVKKNHDIRLLADKLEKLLLS